MQDLHELPRFSDSLSYLYVEHARIDQHDKAIAFHDASGCVPVPIASLAVLMLGPGTTVTHAAIRALADNNCLVTWVGEQALRFYAQGMGGTRSSGSLLRQARLATEETLRLRVVLRMYHMRFGGPLDPSLTLQQIRGKEGVRVREAYATASRETGVPWHGRAYKRSKWDAADPVNRALSAGNACLYGLVHAAVLSAGYSPAIGFIHTGKQLSFVYDVADFYKVDVVVPLAFGAVAEGAEEVERTVRLRCRDAFCQHRLAQRILPDIQEVLNVAGGATKGGDFPADTDPARPEPWWTPSAGGDDVPVSKLVNPGTAPTEREGSSDGHANG